MMDIPRGFGSISGRPDKPNGHFYLTVAPFPRAVAKKLREPD